MAGLVGSQQLGELFQHLRLQRFQVTGTLVGLIGQGSNQQLHHGITLKPLKPLVVVTLPPYINRLAQQLLCPLLGLKYRLFH